MAEQKPYVFIGSSTPNLMAARELAACLDNRNFRSLVWDEGLLRQNESIFDGLLRLAKDVDFAVFIWGASDLIITDEQSVPAIRDNVIFETGLFMGSLGKEKTFIVADRSVAPRIPSDFQGIFRTHFSSSDLNDRFGRSAMSTACNDIQHNIGRIHAPSLTRLQGTWSLQFSPEPSPELSNSSYTVSVVATARGIHLTATNGDFNFTGEGLLHHENQIFGEWIYPLGWSTARGLFMLLVNPIADAMYGFCTTQDYSGRTVFGSWTLGKNDGEEKQLSARLLRAGKLLRESTTFSALQAAATALPETDPLHQSPELRLATLSQTQRRLFFFVLEEQAANGVLESEIRSRCPIPGMNNSQRRASRSGTPSEYYYRLRELLHLGLLSMEKVERFENRWKIRPEFAPALEKWLQFYDPKKRQ